MTRILTYKKLTPKTTAEKSVLAVVLLVFVSGGVAFVVSHASGTPLGFEAESGVRTDPAATFTDTTASNTSATRFGQRLTYASTGIGPTRLQGFAVTGSYFVSQTASQLAQMKAAFPRFKAIRIAIGTTPDNVVASVNEQALITAIQTTIQTVPGIQIVLDDHQSQGAQQTGNTAADISLYKLWASDFKSYPQVSFNTPNEPGGNSIQITAAERQIYDAIRGTGAMNRIWLEDGGNFPADYQSMINSGQMVNIGMDTHLYPTTNTSQPSSDLAAQMVTGLTDSLGVALQQAAFEFGPSLTGPSSGNQPNSANYVRGVVLMAQSDQLVATTAWVWSNGGSLQGLEDLIVDSNGAIGQFGLLLQQNGFAQ